jgi:hypothetical protein
MRPIWSRCSSSFRRRSGSWPVWVDACAYGAMWIPCSQISPPSTRAKASAICTFESRSDFTSLPTSAMPASTTSRIS